MRCGFLVLCLLVASVTSVLATQVVVDQGGNGDYLTIQEGYDAVPAGGTVLIKPGVYPELVYPLKSVSFVASDGLGTVIWDGEDLHRMIHIEVMITVDVRGIEFRNGYTGDYGGGMGAAVVYGYGSQGSVVDCRFVSNRAGHDCALLVHDSGSVLTVTNSEFIDNEAPHNAPACGAMNGAQLNIDHCYFADNACPVLSGAVAGFYASLSITNSVFLRNTGSEEAAIRVYGGSGDISNNTLFSNSGNWVVKYPGGSGTFSNNIVCGNTVGGGLGCDESVIHFDNIYYETAADPVAIGIGAGEMVAPPLFCNSALDDFHLCADSPAATAADGLIGALPVGCAGCSTIPTEVMHWGEVKSLYR